MPPAAAAAAAAASFSPLINKITQQSLAQQRGGVVLVEELLHGVEKPLPVARTPQNVRVVPKYFIRL